MDNNFPYNHRINYNTFVTGVWIPYNGWRVKSLHDVKLRDGTIVTQLRPNGGAWYGSKFDIKDDDVIAIRVVPDEERGKYEYTGDLRIERDIHYFGHSIPVWLEDEQRFIYPDEVPDGKFITPLQQALWKRYFTKEGDEEESWEVIVLTVTGRLSDNKLLSFTNDELVLLFDHSDSRLTTPEVLSERIRNKALTGFNSF